MTGLADKALVIRELEATRLLPDPARMEHRELVERRHENTAVLEKERTFFREECFEDRQVQHCRIHLHLAEVRIDRGGERGSECRGPRADRSRRPGRSTPTLPDPLSRRASVNGRSSSRRGGDSRSLKISSPNCETRPWVPLGCAFQKSTSPVSTNVASDLKSPNRDAGLRHRETDLRERDSEFGVPSFRRNRRADLPDRFVVVVLARVVVQRHVALHAGRVRGEVVGREPVVPWIQPDADLVAGRNRAAAPEPRADAGRRPDVAASGHVEIAVVVRHLDDRPLARGGHVVRILLDEVVD